jgi:adenine-specific DNA-methyltransferase
MYVQTPFNFTGSKYKVLDQIIPNMDTTSMQDFVDLFAGGGSVYTNVIKLYRNIIVNDKIRELIEIHERLLIDDQIIHDVKKLVVEKDDAEGYGRLRESFNEYPTAEKLWALMLCCQNNMMRFNQQFKFNQTFGKRTYNTSTEKKVREFVEHLRPEKGRINFISMNFDEVPIMKNTFYYVDPPYGFEDKDGRIGKKQISEAGYNAYYSAVDDMVLFEYLRKIDEIGSQFMISGLLEHNGKKSWLLNKLIKEGYNWKELEYDYHKVSRQKEVDKKSREIIIMNYDRRS